MARKIKSTEPRVTANLGIDAETLRKIEILTLQMRQRNPKARRGDMVDHLLPWALARGYPKE
jgi:hypothetical protein